MKEYSKDGCHFHPRELVIGICALCLNEKLLILAAKQGTILHHHHHHHQTQKKISTTTSKKSLIALTKIFALTSLFNLLEIKREKPNQDCISSSTTPEDSCISIKFEDNGVSSWDKGCKFPKMPFDHPWNENEDKAKKKIKSVVTEHSEPRGMLRWRKRISHLLQLIRLNKLTKGNMCHVGTKPRRGKS